VRARSPFGDAGEGGADNGDVAEKFATVDEYIGSFPSQVREVLERVRRTLRDAVPDADEKISYQIPTITLHGRYLVYFAAWKHHLAVYPVPGGDEEFEAEIAPHRAAKGTLRFPFNKPIPYELIGRVAVRLKDSAAGA
jgi:uncharacterized protein YdhG (YjbR/CyaY superfamily)